jgi:tRNA (mo5U34)-methyltransferase
MSAVDGVRVRSCYAVDDTVVSAFGLDDRHDTSEARRRRWIETYASTPPRPHEFLLPRVVRRIERQWPVYSGRQQGHLDFDADRLRARVQELGPWSVPFRLGQGVGTMGTDTAAVVAASRVLFRRDLICGTLATLLGDRLAQTTVLDLGCSAGFFSLDLATRGAQHVDGVDLRPANVAQARFLAEHFGVDNVSFTVSAAEEFEPGRRWDVVLNLGLLYHVTQPIELVRKTYELCCELAIIDTVCFPEPVSAFILYGDKDVGRLVEGKESYELVPTYRAVIDVMRHVGFSEVIEVVGKAERGHKLYDTGNRRCFLAVK